LSPARSAPGRLYRQTSIVARDTLGGARRQTGAIRHAHRSSRAVQSVRWRKALTR